MQILRGKRRQAVGERDYGPGHKWKALSQRDRHLSRSRNNPPSRLRCIRSVCTRLLFLSECWRVCWRGRFFACEWAAVVRDRVEFNKNGGVILGIGSRMGTTHHLRNQYNKNRQEVIHTTTYTHAHAHTHTHTRTHTPTHAHTRTHRHTHTHTHTDTQLAWLRL